MEIQSTDKVCLETLVRKLLRDISQEDIEKKLVATFVKGSGFAREIRNKILAIKSTRTF
ncbi:MAG: hypothetical protein HQL69_05585 [Magnetococcales bacterium]|nr:hypothetical protein [Magnetococcales bacterium]